jgi:uncharacterized RDD family membrane protein YckC
MSDPQRIGTSDTIRPHAYDPDSHPEYFTGVLSRRFMAFILDVIIIVVPIIMLTLFIAIFGLVTLGIGWLLFFLLTPIFVLWAIVYIGATLGSPQSATIGMRTLGLEMRTWYGSTMYFLLGAVHIIFFWALMTSLTPLILLVGLFNRRRRLLHDFLTGTIVINNGARVAELKRVRGR